MKITIIILAVLGALAAAFLGMKWLGDLGTLAGMSELERETAKYMAAAEGKSLDKMGTAALVLVASAVAGIAGAVFAWKGKFALAGGLLLGAGLLPVVVQPQTLVFTFFLVVAGGLAVYMHTRTKSAVPGAIS